MAANRSYIHWGRYRIHRAWIMLVACACLSIGYLAMIFAVGGNFYVAICDDTGIARSQISLWQTVHFVSAAIFMPVYGKLYDKFNIRGLLTVAALGCVLGAFLMSTYSQWWQWIISGFLYGSLGAGLMYLPQAVILGNWFHKCQGFALGLCMAISSLAGALLSPLFAMIIANIGWRSAYVVQAFLIALFTLPFTVFVIAKKPEDIGAEPYGWNAEIDRDVVGKAAEAEPMRQKGMSGVSFKRGLRSVAFLMLFIFAGISALIGSGFDAHMPGYAVSLGYGSLFGSLLVSALFVGSCVEKLIMGWVNDRIGVQKAVFIEFALVILGLFGLLLFRNEYLLIGAAFIFGVQDSFLSLSLPLLTRSFFGDRDFTQLYAWASIGSGLLGSLGSPLVGFSFDVTGSYLPAFSIAIGICCIGCVCLLIGQASASRLRKSVRALA